MPPRYSYWTIIAGGLPTAFRAAEREDILPTFARLKEKHPDAELRWFARGKLWESPAAAREALERMRARPSGPDRRGGPSLGRRSADGAKAPGAPAERRGRDWRPGGAHKDPRQKFADAKKARNQRWRTEKFEKKRGDRDRRPEEPKPTSYPTGPKAQSRPAGPKAFSRTPERGKARPWGKPPQRSSSGPPRSPAGPRRSGPRPPGKGPRRGPR